MGIGMAEMMYVSERGFLNAPGARILDIGSQCLLNVKPGEVREFAARHGSAVDEDMLARESERIAYFSTPRPGERTTYLSELIELTRLFYTSYDVAPALKTEIFDLNREAVPEKYRGHFQVVLNFGTTEHIINQMNCFRVMHDALASGGIFYHQLPSTGWINHGYFCYHRLFFEQLAEANDYEIVEIWHALAGAVDPRSEFRDVRPAGDPSTPNSHQAFKRQGSMPSYLINAVMRKRADAPFRVSLELATAHAAAADNAPRLADDPPPEPALPAAPPNPAADAAAIRAILGRVPKDDLLAEVRKRIVRRVRALGGLR